MSSELMLRDLIWREMLRGEVYQKNFVALIVRKLQKEFANREIQLDENIKYRLCLCVTHPL